MVMARGRARSRAKATHRARACARRCFCTGVNQASLDEPAAVELYKKLMDNAPDEEAKRTIAAIRADEMMHKAMFRAMKERFGC